MNLQLVFGHSGNTETGCGGHESAHHTIGMFARMKHCQQELLRVVASTLLIFHMPLSGPSPGDPSSSTSVEQQTL